MTEVAWVAVDWGTSTLRAHAVAGDGDLLDIREMARGMGGLKPDEFEATLQDILLDWVPQGRVLTVIACGMVGARQGWIEAPYAPCPGPPLSALGLTRAPTTDPRLDVWIVPGMAQNDPPDVMRGEETQVAGLLATEPDFEGIVCLPGTHTKWVRVARGVVTGFSSCMTGEVFALLAERSILRHSVGDGEADQAAFLRGVEDGVADGGALLARLFSIRAGDLLHGLTPEAARGRLSGLLIGAEVAAMARGASDVAVLGDAKLTKLYADALGAAGTKARALPAIKMTLEGLRAAYGMRNDA